MPRLNELCRQTATNHIESKNHTLSLFLISALALYLELLLIRWIGTEINIFAYLQNTVLVVCFMGLGMGCLTCRQPIVLRDALMPLFILVLLLSIPITREFMGNISLLLSALDDLVVWQMVTLDSSLKTVLAVSGGLLATFGLMLFIWEIFVPLGRILGRLMDDHPRPIWAYSVNIAGSLVGIWAFVLLSVFYQPPATWFLVVAVLLLFFVGVSSSGRGINFILLFGIVVLSWFAGRDPNMKEVLWSPYQKLALSQTGQRDFPFNITVNNTGFQHLVDFKGKKFPQIPDSSSEIPELSEYDLPALLHDNPQKVLIVGAGAGNDVAGVLRHPGIKEITAVEIDPVTIHLGRRYHPEKPYGSPKVKIVTDDARAFFATSQERYNVIVFGFLDSHTTTSMTNARLDHYVYTRESLERARTLLADRGILVLKFVAQRPYIPDRLGRVLRDIFHEEPIFYQGPPGFLASGGAIFIAGDLNVARRRIAADSRLESFLATLRKNVPQLTYQTRMTTDDWPYLYLDTNRIPTLYYLLAAMILLLFLYTNWRSKFGGQIINWNQSHWHFFFLGAAFLLLEVQNISKASVVLGNTWQVNAVIISGILTMILLANLISAKFPRIPLWLVYLGLIGSCVALYFLDLARFGFLPYYEKAAIVGALTALPVLFSGIVFIRSFGGVISKDMALGANLIGSLVGGLLQSVTFITGIKALLLIVAALYCGAMFLSPRASGTFVAK